MGSNSNCVTLYDLAEIVILNTCFKLFGIASGLSFLTAHLFKQGGSNITFLFSKKKTSHLCCIVKYEFIRKASKIFRINYLLQLGTGFRIAHRRRDKPTYNYYYFASVN